MDYAEEQAMELEALEAILGDEGLLTYTGTVPTGWSEDKPIHKIMIKPEEVGDSSTDLSFDLLFQHTDCYPEEVPHLKVSNTRGLNDAEVGALTDVMTQEADANVGMSSIFTVMQAAKDWLERREGLAAAVDPETLRKLKEEEEERLRLEHRAQGTPVNEKTFAEWRKAFDTEMLARKEASGEAAAEADRMAKMSGKQWFLEKDRPEPSTLDDDDDDFEDDEDDEDEEYDLDEDGGDDDGDEEDEDEDFLDEYLEERKT